MGGKLLTDKLVFRWLEGVGAWSLDSATPSEFAYLAHVGGLSTSALDDYFGGGYRDSTDGWGQRRVTLKPVGGTNTFGRSGFFLHGGTYFGSAGCIDIGHADVKWLDRIRRGGKKIKLYVKYRDKEGRMKHHKGTDRWPLTPWSNPKKIGIHRPLSPREMGWAF